MEDTEGREEKPDAMISYFFSGWKRKIPIKYRYFWGGICNSLVSKNKKIRITISFSILTCEFYSIDTNKKHMRYKKCVDRGGRTVGIQCETPARVQIQVIFVFAHLQTSSRWTRKPNWPPKTPRISQAGG